VGFSFHNSVSLIKSDAISRLCGCYLSATLSDNLPGQVVKRRVLRCLGNLEIESGPPSDGLFLCWKEGTPGWKLGLFR
jgi:hypothetical protein